MKETERDASLTMSEWDEYIGSFDEAPAKATLFPATDEEIAQAIESFGGFPDTSFRRIAPNVVIADGSIVVVLKLRAENVATLYIVDEDWLNSYGYDHIRGKVWGTEEIIADIRKATEISNKTIKQ